MPTFVSPVYAVLLENLRIMRQRELLRVEDLERRNVQLRAQIQGMREVIQEHEDRRVRRERRRFGLRGGVFRVYFEEDP